MNAPRCIQVVDGLDNPAAGPSYTVVRLAEALAARGLQTEIFSLADSAQETSLNGVRRRTFLRAHSGVPPLSRIGASPALRQAICDAAHEGALLHIHGLWRMANVYPGAIAAAQGVPLVLSPRGMLGAPALQFSVLQKRLFWWTMQRRAVRAATCLHATAESERRDIRDMGLELPVAIIPNGVDIPPASAIRPDTDSPTALYLGRLHPKKGLDRLLRAWQCVEDGAPQWTLRIVGPSEGNCRADLESLAAALGLSRVRFEGPLFGEAKQKAYADASLFVLPTRHENFGMVVAEALAQATPVITTKGAPWPGLEREACGWWTEPTPEGLEAALRQALSEPPERLRERGERGHRWMARDFAWTRIAEQMSQLYAWCLGTGAQPDFVEP